MQVINRSNKQIMKNTIIAILVLVVIGLLGYMFLSETFYGKEGVDDEKNSKEQNWGEYEEDENTNGELNEEVSFETQTVIGNSVEGREIKAYHFANEGNKEMVFIGGIHGGYSWNTALLGYELIDYIRKNPNFTPMNTKITVIPAMNPDGLYKITGKEGVFEESDVEERENMEFARFNENEVDLNRNFDCDWSLESKWQNKTVSGGTSEFSEPESMAIKNYIEKNNPDAVIVWYSAAGGVFTSSCHNGVLEETRDLTNAYADASGYSVYKEFDFYEITGDMVNWLAKIDIPAISVLLSNHKDTEWEKNKKGIEAVIDEISE